MAVEVGGGKPGSFRAPARVTCDSHIGIGHAKVARPVRASLGSK